MTFPSQPEQRACWYDVERSSREIIAHRNQGLLLPLHSLTGVIRVRGER